MPFQLPHTLLSKHFIPVKHTEGEFIFFTVDLKGEFPVLFPGRLTRGASSTFVQRVRVDSDSADEGPGTAPLHGGVKSIKKEIPLTLRLFTPTGQEFTAAEIKLADLKKFRNARGEPSGPWKFTLTGESERIFVDEITRVSKATGKVGINLLETIPSESAPPLVANAPIKTAQRSFQFDLFRVGTFVAEMRSPFAQARGSMRLIDPDGVEVAKTTTRTLTFEVEQPTLGKSRDALGRVRKWTLEVSRRGAAFGIIPRVNATVIGRGKITIEELQSRIDTLLGPRGEIIQIFGEDKGGEALVRLRINDVVSAETIDMHGLLEGVLKRTKQDEGADPEDIQAGVVYTLDRRSDEQDFHTKLKMGSFKTKTINVDIGPGFKLGAKVPTIKVTIPVSGKGKIKLGPATIADIEVPGNQIGFEIGIKLSDDGTPEIVTSVPDTLLDGDVHPGAAAILVTSGVGILVAAKIESSVDNKVEAINDSLVEGIRALSNPTLASRILMTIFGAHLTYKQIRLSDNGDEILFDFIAPLEPDPRPTPGYHGAIGRKFTLSSTNAVTFDPPTLGDTWAADNLINKIDHIVYVMMENRSYDHVLGYRAGPPFNDGANGLTDELKDLIEKAPGGSFKVRNLGEEGKFAENSLHLMTRLPVGVGHEFPDVQQQLSVRAPGLGGGEINSPKGFVDNFKPRLVLKPGEPAHNVVPNDVLGYYDHLALPFFDYLATNYAYCDHYYCSHPGPTLPNRMYSLTGDLQRDRYGVPIVGSNDGDNFLLSRAPTIYDFMTRRSLDTTRRKLDFRVYESFPSVTMLRMFARYATDNHNIVSIGKDFANLKADVARGDLPAFTVIEPQMHAHPEDDDHPPADMHRGQIFLKNVYEVLTSNPGLWQRTLLIITYDEHGGLYDHVVPRIADVYTESGGLILNPNLGASLVATTAVSTSATPPVTPPPRRAGKFTFPAKISEKVLSSLGNLPQLTRVPPPPLSIPYGLRVPTFVVSPWTKAGHVSDLTLDHCSVLKTVLACFFGPEKPFLSDRVSASNSFDKLLTEAAPRMDVPAFNIELKTLQPEERKRLNRTSKITTKPLSRKAMRAGPVDYHDLSGRWARQLGR